MPFLSDDDVFILTLALNDWADLCDRGEDETRQDRYDKTIALRNRLGGTMPEPTSNSVAHVLAEDIDGGNTLRVENFDNTSSVTTGGVRHDLDGDFFYVGCRVNGDERMFKVRVSAA